VPASIHQEDTLQFWDHSQTSLDKVYLPALRALSVPASSAAVERVLSQGVNAGSLCGHIGHGWRIYFCHTLFFWNAINVTSQFIATKQWNRALCFVQKQLPIVIDDMLLLNLAAQFEHTNCRSKMQTGQKMNKIAAVSA